MFRQLSTQVTLLAHTGRLPTPEQQEQLAALGIPVATGIVTRVDSAAGGLSGVRFADGSRVELDALVVAPVCRARVELLAPFDMQLSEVRLTGICWALRSSPTSLAPPPCLASGSQAT